MRERWGLASLNVERKHRRQDSSKRTTLRVRHVRVTTGWVARARIQLKPSARVCIAWGTLTRQARALDTFLRPLREVHPHAQPPRHSSYTAQAEPADGPLQERRPCTSQNEHHGVLLRRKLAVNHVDAPRPPSAPIYKKRSVHEPNAFSRQLAEVDEAQPARTSPPQISPYPKSL